MRQFRSFIDDFRTYKKSVPNMKLLFVAELHYELKQFDWLALHAHEFDTIPIGGDLLELASTWETNLQLAAPTKE